MRTNPGYLFQSFLLDLFSFYCQKSIYFSTLFLFQGLDPEYTYDFRVVAVDGDHETPSETIPVYTYPGPGKGGLNQQPMATSGWFIGMMLAVVFLILCCVVVCLIKRNRGGKYAVQESEERQGRRDPYDDGGFPEYTQP